jgi:hypothetical protein
VRFKVGGDIVEATVIAEEGGKILIELPIDKAVRRFRVRRGAGKWRPLSINKAGAIYETKSAKALLDEDRPLFDWAQGRIWMNEGKVENGKG